MPFLTYSRPLCPSLLALLPILFTVNVSAAQTCQYASIRATAPASRFIDNLDGTVTDQASGLQWKRCAEGQTWSGGTCTGSATTHTWQQALQLADSASYAGQSDWRLPNIKEFPPSLSGPAMVPPSIWPSSPPPQRITTSGLRRRSPTIPTPLGTSISTMAAAATAARTTSYTFVSCAADSNLSFVWGMNEAVALRLAD